MARDTWFTYDLPVLDAIVTHLDEHGAASLPDLSVIAEATGIDVLEVGAAAERLNGRFIDLTMGMSPPDEWTVDSVTPAAREAVGSWPSPESLSARILAELAEQADAETDPEQKGRLRAAADVLGGTAKDVGTSVLTYYVERAMGLR